MTKAANTKLITSISVVIPTYNGRSLLEKHLPSVVAILESGDQIVVVDDASNDDTLTWLSSQKKDLSARKIKLTVVEMKKNQRFAAAVNAGVKACKHPYVLLLNNDVSPLTPSLRDQLLAWFSNPKLFAVGCGEVRENKSNAQLFGRGTGNWQRGFLAHHYDPNQQQYATLWTAGGSMMFDKKKFEQLNGFDTLFYPAYEEDRDLSYRALKRGWNLVFDFQTLVWHQHESTNKSVFGQQKMEINSWKNQFIIVWKNIDSWRLLQHLLWLPYHLLITNNKSSGALGRGFWLALKLLPQVVAKRRQEKRHWQLTDSQVLQNAKTFYPSEGALAPSNEQ